MAVRSGRQERRISLAVPVEISTLQDPSVTERTCTEDVCSVGVRVLTRQPRERNERLVVRALEGSLRAQARVVYCQKHPSGRFAVGLRFVGMRVKEW